MLRLTVSRPVRLGVEHPCGPQDQIFATVREFRVLCCGALSLTRRRVCRLQLLLALASAVILGSESRGTHDHIVTCKSIPRQRPQYTHGPTRNNGTTGICNPLLGNGSVNTHAQ
jgi:hypothetical protein